MNPIIIMALIASLQKEVVLLEKELAQQQVAVATSTPILGSTQPNPVVNCPSEVISLSQIPAGCSTNITILNQQTVAITSTSTLCLHYGCPNPVSNVPCFYSGCSNQAELTSLESELATINGQVSSLQQQASPNVPPCNSMGTLSMSQLGGVQGLEANEQAEQCSSLQQELQEYLQQQSSLQNQITALQ